MTAIAGLWRFDNKPDPGSDCARMLAAQEIYGPHGTRSWSRGALAVGRSLYRRLPEDSFDNQPLHSRDRRLTLVADVRIDNRDELMAALGVPPVEAAQLCDTAILLACLEHWGDNALDRLAGDYAFALWNEPAQSMTLARDFNGQAPLHYHRGRDFFAFASMPKGLHALADIPRAPDEEAVAAFLAHTPRIPSHSYFAGIERVLPAHVVTVTRDRLVSRRYWQPRRPALSSMRTDDYIDGLRFHLDQATQARLRGVTGVVGAHLSGGLDSGGVTATAARLLAPRGNKVVAYTAVPRERFDGLDRPGSLGDEGLLAAATAAHHSNIEHVLIRSGHVSPVAGLARSAFLCERPIVGPSNWVWVSAINDSARARGLTIMLTGQMGNAGMSHDGLGLLPALLRQGRVLRLWQEAAALAAQPEMTWRGVAARTFGPSTPEWLWRGLHRLVRAPLNYRRGGDGFDGRVGTYGRGDGGNYNKGILAGWGIDLRDPTADRRLVEYCLSVPTEQYLANGVPRALARRALADRLPAMVLNERKKGFQAADWHEGLTAARPEIIAELARLSASESARRVIDIDRLQALAAHWPQDGWERHDRVQPYRLALLRGLAAGHFLRHASGDNG